LHAYHTERVLDASAGLRPLARLAGSHGERCDGSGYHRGSRSTELPLTAWLLAAADCYHALGEPRPHRRAMTAAAAASELTREAEAGRLEADAVHAVLTAAGPGTALPGHGRAPAATTPASGIRARRAPAHEAGRQRARKAGRAFRAGVRGTRPAGHGPGHQAGRAAAGDLAEDV
jgi:hypothetical protein